MDLAEGHLAALNNITPGHAIYNLGTGMGTTVLELRKAYEIVSEKKIPYEFAERRPGDVGIVTADVTKAEQELGWKATRDVIQICHDSWNWVENNPDGYV
jgi:UDP-glucose 4-epimerase